MAGGLSRGCRFGQVARPIACCCRHRPTLSGDHLVELRSATFVPAGDQRSIGTPVNSISIVGQAGPALPAWRSMLGWLVAAALAWLALRRAGFGSSQALALLLPAAFLASLAALLDPPRFAIGAAPALVALGAWIPACAAA